MALNENKNYIYIGVALIVVIVIAIYSSGRDKMTENDLDILTSSPFLNPSPTIQPSSTPKETPRPQPPNFEEKKPKPELIIKEFKTYDQLAEQYQEEGTRFIVNDDCTEIRPSNLALPNNIQVMFDNSESSIRHIIKIGGREYLMEAGEWFMAILSSQSTPITLPIYCGSMELGQIELVN